MRMPFLSSGAYLENVNHKDDPDLTTAMSTPYVNSLRRTYFYADGGADLLSRTHLARTTIFLTNYADHFSSQRRVHGVVTIWGQPCRKITTA